MKFFNFKKQTKSEKPVNDNNNGHSNSKYTQQIEDKGYNVSDLIAPVKTGYKNTAILMLIISAIMSIAYFTLCFVFYVPSNIPLFYIMGISGAILGAAIDRSKYMQIIKFSLEMEFPEVEPKIQDGQTEPTWGSQILAYFQTKGLCILEMVTKPTNTVPLVFLMLLSVVASSSCLLLVNQFSNKYSTEYSAESADIIDYRAQIDRLEKTKMSYLNDKNMNQNAIDGINRDAKNSLYPTSLAQSRSEIIDKNYTVSQEIKRIDQQIADLNSKVSDKRRNQISIEQGSKAGASNIYFDALASILLVSSVTVAVNIFSFMFEIIAAILLGTYIRANRTNIILGTKLLNEQRLAQISYSTVLNKIFLTNRANQLINNMIEAQRKMDIPVDLSIIHADVGYLYSAAQQQKIFGRVLKSTLDSENKSVDKFAKPDEIIHPLTVQKTDTRFERKTNTQRENFEQYRPVLTDTNTTLESDTDTIEKSNTSQFLNGSDNVSVIKKSGTNTIKKSSTDTTEKKRRGIGFNLDESENNKPVNRPYGKKTYEKVVKVASLYGVDNISFLARQVNKNPRIVREALIEAGLYTPKNKYNRKD